MRRMKIAMWAVLIVGGLALTGCSALTGKPDIKLADAHLRSDAKCSGAFGQVLGKVGVQTALTAVGLPANTVNAASAVLTKLSGALEKDASPDTMLSPAEVCAVVGENIAEDVAGGKVLIDKIKAKIEALKAKRAAKTTLWLPVQPSGFMPLDPAWIRRLGPPRGPTAS